MLTWVVHFLLSWSQNGQTPLVAAAAAGRVANVQWLATAQSAAYTSELLVTGFCWVVKMLLWALVL